MQPQLPIIARYLAAVLCVSALCLLPAVLLRASPADNPPLGDAVGFIEGDSISVQGPMTVDSSNGQVRTMLRSGGDVRVKSGQARIDLVEGGSVAICGPAHFSVLKSGGSLTIALDAGIIHAHIEGGAPALTIYTPQIQARPVPIANGLEDTLVGVDSAGAMCIRAGRGAVRIEQQLTGQSLLIPQNGDVALTGGQLETLQSTSGSHCTCELEAGLKPVPVSTQIGTLASTEELNRRAALPKPAAPTQTAPSEEPVYQVIMPPLRYNAGAKVQQDYDPNLILLVRRARVRPSLIFQGKVEGDPVVAQAAAPGPPPNAQKPADSQKPSDDSTWNRVRSFFHKLWSPAT